MHRAALALSPSHLKAITRAAQCEAKLNRFSEAAQWCDRWLLGKKLIPSIIDLAGVWKLRRMSNSLK